MQKHDIIVSKFLSNKEASSEIERESDAYQLKYEFPPSDGGTRRRPYGRPEATRQKPKCERMSMRSGYLVVGNQQKTATTSWKHKLLSVTRLYFN